MRFPDLTQLFLRLVLGDVVHYRLYYCGPLAHYAGLVVKYISIVNEYNHFPSR